MTQIIVGVDESDGAAEALRWALREARLRGWSLTAVMAWGFLDQYQGRDPFAPHYDQREALAALDEAVVRAVGETAAASVERRVECELAPTALVTAANEANLLVVGARGIGGFQALSMGSVSQHCLHHAPCPVAIVRPPEAQAKHTTERIVVGVDGSGPSRLALRWALDEASLRQAAVEVVHAWSSPLATAPPFVVVPFDPRGLEQAARQQLDALVDSVDGTGQPIPVKRILANGSAGGAILNVAKGADLIVMGARGLGGFLGLLLGSVSQQVAHHARCPLVVVRTS